MKILRQRLFSKKKKKEEGNDIKGVIKSGAILSATPLAISQVATRIDDRVAKKENKKEVQKIKKQTEKFKEEATEVAKNEIRKAEAEAGVGKVSKEIGSILDTMGIKREPNYVSEEEIDNLKKFNKNVREILKESHKKTDIAANERIKAEGEFLRSRLKTNRGIRKLGVGVAAIPAGLTVASVAALKKQKRRKKEGGK